MYEFSFRYPNYLGEIGLVAINLASYSAIHPSQHIVPLDAVRL